MGSRGPRIATVVAALMLFAPAAGHAATATAVTMLSDGDYIGGGTPRLFHPGNAQITSGGNSGDLSVSVSGGTSGDSYSLEFAAPPGQQLAPGVYNDAQRAPFREAGRPGIDIGGDGRGCNTIEGRFEVKAISFGASGALERLWIVYEQHCEGGTAALFGEVAVGMPVADAHAVAAPSVMRWPEGENGRPGSVQPVTLIAPPGGAQLGGVSLAGANPGDFTIRTDECGGRSLPANATCQVWVRFAPTAPGTRTAKLVVGGANGADAELQGWTHGGRTRLEMQSDQGDYIGQGLNWSYTNGNARIAAAGSRSNGVAFGLGGDDGSDWSGEFRPGAGDILAPGPYNGAQRAAFASGGAPGLDIGGNGRGCNTISGSFNVSEATFDPNGALRTFGTTFEQHCEGGAPALRGVFEFRVGDDVQPAPWMVGGPSAGAGNPAPEAGGPCPDRMSLLTATRRGTRRADRIRGRNKAELLLGYRGSDRIFGGGGADCIVGGPGNDRLNGGSGSDMILGGPGRDVIAGGPGRDLIDCGSGRDVVRLGRGDRAVRCERKLR